MNNFDEVQKNFKKWFNIDNKENFEEVRLQYLNTHKVRGLDSIQIEPTNRCNFNCIMCPIEDLKYKKDLSFDEFKMILSKIPSSVKKIYLVGLGEPFLNKDYMKMLKLAKEKSFEIEIYTNGSLFDVEALKYADRIRFSIDGVDKNLLKQIRKGINPDIVFENLRKAIKLGKENNCKIGINYTVNHMNFKNIKDFYDFCDLINVDYVNVQSTLNTYYPGSKKYIEMKKFIEKDNKLIDWEFVVNSYTKNYDFELTILYPKKLKGFCSWCFSKIYVTANLDVVQCCNQVTSPIVFGNLKENSVEEIYFSEKMEKFRKKHINNESIFLCDNCPY